MRGSPCVSSNDVGSVFGQVDPNSRAFEAGILFQNTRLTAEGTVSTGGNAITGTYLVTTGSCIGDEGTFRFSAAPMPPIGGRWSGSISGGAWGNGAMDLSLSQRSTIVSGSISFEGAQCGSMPASASGQLLLNVDRRQRVIGQALFLGFALDIDATYDPDLEVISGILSHLQCGATDFQLSRGELRIDEEIRVIGLGHQSMMLRRVRTGLR